MHLLRSLFCFLLTHSLAVHRRKGYWLKKTVGQAFRLFGAAAVAGLAGLAAVGPITAVAAAGGAGYIASTKASEAGALLRDVGGVAYGAGEDARRFERRYQLSEGLSAAGGAAVHGAKVTWDRASSLNREHRVTAKLGEAAHATARGLGTAAERARGAKVPKPNKILSIFK